MMKTSQQKVLMENQPTLHKKLDTTRARTPQNAMSNSRSANALISRALGIKPHAHALNTSKSKQMFSFGIGQRFKPGTPL